MRHDQLRISIIGLHYAPESSGNAPYTTRLAERLASQGHEVRVLTGYPHYPEWKLAEGYSGWQRTEVVNGVQVLRLRHFIPSKVNAISRLHMELSFGVRLLFSKWGRPHVLIVISPALFATAFACLRARFGLQKPPTGIWIQDLYSRGLEETGLGNSRMAKVMKLIEGSIIRSATGVTVIHQRFADYLTASLGVPAQDVRVIRNWTHVAPSGQVDREAVRRSHGWNDDEIIVLHAGNMGVKQGLENVVEAAKVAESTGSKVRFVLLGDGNQRPRLQALSQAVSTLQIIDPVADEEFMPILRSADVLLVHEHAGLREMSVPSKLTSYFSARRPVLAVTEEDSTTAHEIVSSNAGLLVPPLSPRSLVETAERLGSDLRLAEKLADAGVVFSEQHLSESTAIVSYESWIREMVEPS